MSKLSSKDWVYATLHINGKTFFSFAQAEGDVDEPRGDEHVFLRTSIKDSVEFTSTVFVVNKTEELVQKELESLGFKKDTARRVYILSYLLDEGLFEEDYDEEDYDD